MREGDTVRGGTPRATLPQEASARKPAAGRGTRTRGAAPRTAVFAVAALAALGGAACSKKNAIVDPTFTAPEGVASLQTGLLVWREIPNHLLVFEEGQPEADPPVPDDLVAVYPVAAPGGLTGQFHGAILDSTPANAYQVFRREPNGGYRELYDFSAVPSRRWLDRGWETYHFTDPDTAVPSRTYRGRGIVGGTITLSSPLTRESNNTVREVPDITYTGGTGFNVVGDPVALDSLFLMEWERVPNAAAYVIHVYQWSFALTDLNEQIMSGRPAPLFIGKSRDILVAYLPAPDTTAATVSFRMPTPAARPPEARIMTVRQTNYGQEYLVRISAVDASGQLIAYTYGSHSQKLTDILIGGAALPASQFAVFWLGAVKVVPSRPTGTPALPPSNETRRPSPLPSSQYGVFPRGAVTVVLSGPRTTGPDFPRRDGTLRP